MNYFLAYNSLIYHLFSKHKYGHAIHSPFVYSFIREVFRDKKLYSEYETIEKERKSLKRNSLRIPVRDFGAGSHVINTQTRRVSKIAQTSLSPQKYAQLLFRIVRHSHAKKILEIGSSLGISGAYLSKAVPDAQFISLEGCESIAQIAQETYEACACENAEIRHGNFADTVKPALHDLQKIDIAFIDGNHQEEATLNYFETILPYCHSETILIFDDIYWSKGMNRAWKKICADNRISITIDICKMGLVFFKSGIVKQNFRIRF